MYIKNRHLQILPDGTVNGSNDDTSDYTIFQRTSVSRGQLWIQGVATCLYLCMDSCGLLYGSREYTDDCVFNETLEQHNYNTYSSAKWSTTKKTLYLGLNRRGQPRRVQAKGHNLGRLSAYARVLTQVAPLERVEALQRRMLGAEHNVRHRHNSHRGDLIQQSLCPTLPVQEKDGRDKFRCRKRKKRKKRKRKCRPGEKPGPQCQVVKENGGVSSEGVQANSTAVVEAPSATTPESKRSCEGAASEEACRREALSVPSKKRKLRVDEATEARNVTASNGKSKAPASKKVNAAGSISQSKKPNLTDGKKKKKKVPAPRRNQPAAPLARKRFTAGRAGSTSAAPTATSASIPATSSSSWWSPGASTAPSGRGASPRRKAKLPRNEGVGPNPGSRRAGKAFAKNRAKTIDRVAVTAPYEATTIPDLTSRTTTTKVPETISDRSPQSLSSVEVPEASEDTSRSLSESLHVDDDPTSTISSEHTTTTVDSTSVVSVDANGTPTTTLRAPEDESRSVEEVDDSDDDRFDTPETMHSTTPEVSLEKLVM
nr:mucin-5AC isoform X2 [Nomia melanderi]